MRDRVTATKMGAFAIDLLLEGKSDVVVCEVDGKLVTRDIKWALAADKYYKKTLKPGELDKFSEAEINEMKVLAAKRHADIEKLYNMSLELEQD